MSASLPMGAGLVQRPVLAAKEQVGFLRSLLEAEDGLAFLHGDGSGVLHVLSTEGLAGALDRLLDDLEADGLLVRLR